MLESVNYNGKAMVVNKFLLIRNLFRGQSMFEPNEYDDGKPRNARHVLIDVQRIWMYSRVSSSIITPLNFILQGLPLEN